MTLYEFQRKTVAFGSKKLSDLLFIFYAGGAALLSYSLVYALRKPFTAATFDGMELFGMDYKVATSIIQIFGYMVSKFIGIKLISELKREGRLKFILVSIGVAELSLVLSDVCLVRSMCWRCSSTGYRWVVCGALSSASSKAGG